MNANEIFPKANSRLSRIKIASRCFRILIAISVVLAGITLIGLYLGWIVILRGNIFFPHQTRIVQFYNKFPTGYLALDCVRFGLLIFCALILNGLFQLYERGTFFSAKNVKCFRLLGYYLLIDWVVGIYQLDLYTGHIELALTKPLLGFIIIFVAWIMDEGRKIQEEQELTV